MAHKIAHLRSKTDEELVTLYDTYAVVTETGITFIRDEILRRETTAQNAIMLKFTRQVRDMTIAILVLTAVNVVAATIPLWKATAAHPDPVSSNQSSPQ